jgi:hypothetical protein
MPEEAVVAEVEGVPLVDLLDRVRVGLRAVAVRVVLPAAVAVRVVLTLLVVVVLEAALPILPAPVQPLDRAHLVLLLSLRGVKLGDGLAADPLISRL